MHGRYFMFESSETSIMPLQAVVVRTADWTTFKASLRFYERDSSDLPWVDVLGHIPAVIGKNGLGWGRGIHRMYSCFHPVKREGDGRSPAGIFRFGTAFGYAAPGDVGWIRLPYRQATGCLHCIDDPDSPHYNTLVDTGEVKQVWKSHEVMRREDELYRLGAVIKHNADMPMAGLGSCIFLHIWKGPHEGTSGCTAMEHGDVERLLRRLDPLAGPMLVQLPESEYDRAREIWQLP
jgi:L,D-peptidoglycan transpeptidase YkuD (ErfK/YbiS/YcfS/YnhG family)